MMNYSEFLNKKAISDVASGISNPPQISSMLFPFQREIVNWALRRGRAAIWADCGLGKSPMQLEWARHVAAIEGPVLILAPLAVAQQTVREGKKFGIEVYYERHHPKVECGITITNYEMLDHFDASKFSGVVLDESSILKSYTGKFRTEIIERFSKTPFRLACTATPAPNDYMELGNHAEFLGVLSRTEMLSTFFIHDGGETSKWRLKGHAEDPFWKWLSSWAVVIRRPSDLGFDDTGFKLPELKLHRHVLNTEKATPGFLFSMPSVSLSEQRTVKRETIEDRVKKAAEIVKKSNQPWIVWCELNDESKMLSEMIGAEEVTGSDTMEEKERKLIGFSKGDIRIIVSKPSIAGYGLNWQHCPNMVFSSLSHSYEDFYQAVRRCWRFGQKRPVNVHQILVSAEEPILNNLQRKQDEADLMAEEMVKHMAASMAENMHGTTKQSDHYHAKQKINIPAWIGGLS